MTTAEATAEVFLTALRGLSDEQRSAFFVGLAEDQQFGEDLVDLARLLDRQDEPSRPFQEFLAEHDS